MKLLSSEAFASAEKYLVRNARLIDRLRFAHHFSLGEGSRIVESLLPYQNSDGGFGYALEPDLRGTESQPQHMEVALWILNEVGGVNGSLVERAGDWLLSHSTREGGVPFVLSNVVESERAFWWEPEEGPDGPPANINPTGPIVGVLHENHCEHPWIASATEFCWNYLAAMTTLGAYDALAAMAFLQRVPDRHRAQEEFARLKDSILDTVALDPNAEGHVHSPLDFAPQPNDMARELFSDSDINRHLDAIIDAQNDDGGWVANFPMWTPVVRHEWGGFITIARLKTLQAYGRIAKR